MATVPVIYYNNTLDPGCVEHPTAITGNKRHFGSFFTVAPERLENFSKQTHYDENHALIFTWPFAGGQVVLKMWVEDVEYPQAQPPYTLADNVFCRVYARKRSGGVDVDTLLFDANVIISNYFYSPLSLVKTYGVKLCFRTIYDAALEGTEARSIVFEGYTPAIAPDWDSLVTYANVVPGAILYTSYDYDEFYSDEGLGYGMNTYYGSAASMHIGYYGCSNLEQFAALFGGTVSDIDIEPPKPPVPPQDDDPSGPGGGGGDYDPSSDPIDFPDLPSGGAFASGAIKAFKITAASLAGIFTTLWDASIFDINTFQKLLESPIDAIISVAAVPIAPVTSNNELIKLGGFNTQEYGLRIPNQYMSIDCGSLYVTEFWGSALDYEPYTKIEIFLPYIGIKNLKTEDCMKKTLHVKYNVDVLTGDLVANIKCGQSVLYKYNGSFKNVIPVTSRVYDAMEQLVKGGSMVAAGALMGNAPGAAMAAISTAVNVALSKAQVTRTGNLSGVPGVLDDFIPYLIIHRPAQSLADNFKGFKGYPSNISAVLSSLTGYTEVEYIHLTGVNGATDTELVEIERLLKSGVII